MVREFKFPDLGEGVSEGEIKKWLVKVGDAVKKDQSIAEVETDKAVVEMPSPFSGTILKLNFPEGGMVKVGESLATIQEEGEEPKGPLPPTEPVKEKESVSVVGELPEEETPAGTEGAGRPSAPASGVLATPSVRKLAKDMGIDLRSVKGSGHDGRITEEDVRGAKGGVHAAVQKTVQPKFDIYGWVERKPLRGIRRSTAIHLKEAQNKAVMVTTMDLADVTDLVALRERTKKYAEETKGIKLTYLPFIIKALVSALKKHPYLNSSMDEESNEIILKKYYNVGIAVATEDGLLVPIIKMADDKDIFTLAEELTNLTEQARSRKVDLADLKGGTISITNYGVFGSTYATPIPNFPDVAIVGLGRISDMPVVKDGEIKIRKMLHLSVTFDHRVLDGAEAAMFVNDLKELLENPEIL